MDSLSSLAAIEQSLRDAGMFYFDTFSTGLFPAVGRGSATAHTSGYRAAWIRDNVHIALAHVEGGEPDAAVRCANAMAAFLQTQRSKMRRIIEDDADKLPANRPHIRLVGNGTEIAEGWPHDQNDATGIFVWFFCRLIRQGLLPVTPAAAGLLADLVRYFHAISFFVDEDAGHWEEQRKVNASSIGCVTAGLRAYRSLQKDGALTGRGNPSGMFVDGLIARGEEALGQILPWECREPDPRRQRRFDAALLFLIDPLSAVDDAMADRILDDVGTHLLRDKGIIRYGGDSYFGPDFRKIPPEKRTVDLSDDIISRDAFACEGKEAQWCIFDSVISVALGRRYLRTGDADHLARQQHHLQRTLNQIVTGPDGRKMLPEAFFLENGRWVPDDHMPLQWAHANLWRAMTAMAESLRNRQP